MNQIEKYFRSRESRKSFAYVAGYASHLVSHIFSFEVKEGLL
jgi:hypothetical protein